MARLLGGNVPSPENSSISRLAYADVVLDYFDSGAGPLPGPYGIDALGNNSVPVTPSIILGSNTSGALSLPTGSFVTVGFTDALILDQPGNDIFVLERDFVTEQAEVYVSSDYNPAFPLINLDPFNGANLVLLGTANAGTTSSFDLASIGFTSPVEAVRIVGLDTGGASPGFDVVNVQALQALPDQANFIALEPQWNSENGSLRYGFQVEDADVSFGEDVEVGLYFARDRGIFLSDERISEIFVNQTNPEIIGNQIWYSLPIEDIPLELSNEELNADRILTIVDPDNLIPEINENDNGLGIDYFFVRKIPQIMRNIGEEWEVAASFQERWLNGEEKVLPSGVNNELFEAEPTVALISLDWILQPSVDTDGRAQGAFNQLTDVNYLFSENARDELAERLNGRLEDEPIGTVINFGVEQEGVDALRSQQTQFSPVITKPDSPFDFLDLVSAPTNFELTPLDPLLGALGDFSFYAIPIGEAEKVSNDAIRVTATGVGIYALDIFEFNGFQYLGTWDEPNQASIFPENDNLVYNSTYRGYRDQTGLGQDFVVISTVEERGLISGGIPLLSSSFTVSI